MNLDWRAVWSRRDRWLPLAVVIVAAVVVAAPLHNLFASDRVTARPVGPSSTPSTYQILVACLVTAVDHCDAIRTDLLDRFPLTGAQRLQAEQVASPAMEAVTLLWRRGETCGPAPLPTVYPGVPAPCALVHPPVSVVDLADVLRHEGFPNPVVRVARPDDPAPAGSVIFTVPIGEACWVGSLGLDMSSQVVGQRRDGRCLAA